MNSVLLSTAMSAIKTWLVLSIISGLSSLALAENWPLMEQQEVVGEVRWYRVSEADTLVSVARRFGIGYDAMLRANPTFDIWLPESERYLRLPTQYILPAAAKKGLVLNLAEMRLYYFPEVHPRRVHSFPVGIGREGWETPVTSTRVIKKVVSPAWYPPQSIRDEALANGHPLPDVVPAGPENPLGSHALRLGLSSYLLHGTNRPAGVGMRVSHGCIRLYPEDIVALFDLVSVGVELHIVDQPYKMGWRESELFLEVHPAAYHREEWDQTQSVLPTSLQALMSLVTKDTEVFLDWDQIYEALAEADGVPVSIGIKRSW